MDGYHFTAQQILVTTKVASQLTGFADAARQVPSQEAVRL